MTLDSIKTPLEGVRKIVIDARESGTSTGRYIDKLVEYMHIIINEKKLHATTNITVLTKKHRLDYLKQLAPNFTILETVYQEFTFGEQLGFRKQLQSLQPDLVHFGMVQQPVRYNGLRVTTMHDLTTLRFDNPAKNVIVFKLKQQVYKWVNKKVAYKSAHIIAPSEFVKNDIVNYTAVNPSKITVTPESADKITSASEPYSAVENKSYLLYVGRPQPHKNLKRLIDAYSIVKKAQPQLLLVLVGKQDTAYQQLQTYTQKQGIEGVLFTGWIPDGQLRWLYEHATAYVFPSLSEGFGLPGLEAMHYDLPVISSNATCLPEIYGQAAAYFDPLNTQDMTNTIIRVLEDENLSAQLVKSGHEQLKKYSWQKMAQQTLDVYKQALEQPKA